MQPRDDPPTFEKGQLKLSQKQEWGIPEAGKKFVAAMEEVIEIYTTPHDPPTIRSSALTRARFNCCVTRPIRARRPLASRAAQDDG